MRHRVGRGDNFLFQCLWRILPTSVPQDDLTHFLCDFRIESSLHQQFIRFLRTYFIMWLRILEPGDIMQHRPKPDHFHIGSVFLRHFLTESDDRFDMDIPKPLVELLRFGVGKTMQCHLRLIMKSLDFPFKFFDSLQIHISLINTLLAQTISTSPTRPNRVPSE